MPDITVENANGRASTLLAMVAGERAVILFMRTSTCPVCHAHVAKALGLLRSGQLGGARLVVVTPGSVSEIATVRRRVPGDDVTVVASGSGHADVGLGRFLGLQHSGTFVLDQAGRVLSARTAAVPLGAFDAAEVIAVLAG